MAVLLAPVASGCFGGGSSDRVGGTERSKVVVLTLARHDPDAGIGEWVDAVERLSHGSLRIDVRDDWRRDEVDYEKNTIADVRAGKVDLADIPARAYDTLGVKSFQGLLAPFEIDSFALQRRVLAGSLPDGMLSELDPLGVEGIAILPGGLQKILSISRPMLAPADYRTASTRRRIGIRPSALASGTFRALRTGYTDLAPGGDTGRIAGIEDDLVAIVANRYQSLTAGETVAANVTFWPRISSIVANGKVVAGLSRSQQTALRSAAREALDPSIARLVHDEHAAERTICHPPGQGRRPFFFLTASPSDRAALMSAVRPVYRRLSRDRGTRAVIAEIDDIKKQVRAEAAPRCPGDAARRHPGAVAGTLRVSGELTAVGPSTWTGRVTSTSLGRGRLVLTRHLLFRSFVTGGLLTLAAHFPGGDLGGCVAVSITPAGHGPFRWSGPGVILSASPALRGYAGLSLRFAGITRASDLGHVHGGFITDVPSGLPCDFAQGV